MLSIIRNKLNIVIILMVIFDLTTGTEPGENDWFSQYGAKRDAEDGILQDGMGEDEGEGTLKQKKRRTDRHMRDSEKEVDGRAGGPRPAHDMKW